LGTAINLRCALGNYFITQLTRDPRSSPTRVFETRDRWKTSDQSLVVHSSWKACWV